MSTKIALDVAPLDDLAVYDVLSDEAAGSVAELHTLFPSAAEQRAQCEAALRGGGGGLGFMPETRAPPRGGGLPGAQRRLPSLSHSSRLRASAPSPRRQPRELMWDVPDCHTVVR